MDHRALYGTRASRRSAALSRPILRARAVSGPAPPRQPDRPALRQRTRRDHQERRPGDEERHRPRSRQAQCGALGTLGLLTEVTFKLLPRPESEATLVIRRLDDAQAIAAMSPRARLALRGQRRGASFSAGIGREVARTLLRLEGFADSVAYRIGRKTDRAARRFRRRSMRCAGEDSRAPLARRARRRVPRRPRDARSGGSSRARRSALDFLASARPVARWRLFYDWGGGLIWLRASRPGASAGRGARRAAPPAAMRRWCARPTLCARGRCLRAAVAATRAA